MINKFHFHHNLYEFKRNFFQVAEKRIVFKFEGILKAILAVIFNFALITSLFCVRDVQPLGKFAQFNFSITNLCFLFSFFSSFYVVAFVVLWFYHCENT